LSCFVSICFCQELFSVLEQPCLLLVHPKELSLKDGKVQIEDVQGPKGEGSLEARMEELEQEALNTRRWRNARWTLSIG
jgi:hypothetical protein